MSMTLIPASRAACNVRSACGRSSRFIGTPPNPMTDTLSPVFPSFLYFIVSPSSIAVSSVNIGPTSKIYLVRLTYGKRWGQASSGGD